MKNVQAGVGCGVGIGHGFGLGKHHAMTLESV